MGISQISSLVGLLMGVCSFVAGIILWYRGSIEKSYAAQRDFGHLKRNQEQIAQGIGQNAEELEALSNDVSQLLAEVREIGREVDNLSRSFVEHKGYVQALGSRVEGLSNRFEHKN